MEDWVFRLLRDELIADTRTRNLVPSFVRHNVDTDGLRNDLKDIHTGSGAYAARRKHIADQFQPLLDYLQRPSAPADADVTTTLARYDGEGVRVAWDKALSRRQSDPEGAITAARTLLEEVCKHILDDAGETYEERWDLPRLYSLAAQQMKLAPSQHSEEVFKRILGGCQNVVENLGGLRNKIGDAHAGGRKRVRPAERHAALAVNLSGSMAMFLIETWESRN